MTNFVRRRVMLVIGHDVAKLMRKFVHELRPSLVLGRQMHLVLATLSLLVEYDGRTPGVGHDDGIDPSTGEVVSSSAATA
jgi:hypothetical protein